MEKTVYFWLLVEESEGLYKQDGWNSDQEIKIKHFYQTEEELCVLYSDWSV